MICGWSHTAVAIRPVRSVSGRASRATFRIEAAGYCLIGAIAYAAQQNRHISVQPREISIRSLSASSVRGVRIVVCGTSKVEEISFRDLGCWMTTFELSAASARGPCSAGTKKPGSAASSRRKASRSRPRCARPAIPGTSRSPSPSANASTNGTSTDGFIRAISPPTRRIGCRSSRSSRESGMPAAERVRRMLTTSISHESDQASTPYSESGVPLSNVTAGAPSSWKNRSHTTSGMRLKSR